MSVLRFRDVVVTASDGEPKKAELTECPNDANDTFVIFKLEGTEHPHLQCSLCNTSFCSGGTCS
jgi:hypothetical protein